MNIRSYLYVTLLVWVPFVWSMCASAPDTEYGIRETKTGGYLLETGSYKGYTVFMGYSSRLYDRQKELERCKEIAAIQAAVFLGVQGNITFLKQESSGSVGYFDDIFYTYDRSLVPGLVEDLIVIDDIIDEQGRMLFAYIEDRRFKTSFSEGNLLPKTGQKPAWITEVPTEKGYITGVGQALRHQYLEDSFIEADLRALAELFAAQDTSVQLVLAQNEKNGIGQFKQESISLQNISGKLTEGRIVSRWIDPDNRYFYSLAVARQPY